LTSAAGASSNVLTASSSGSAVSSASTGPTTPSSTTSSTKSEKVNLKGVVVAAAQSLYVADARGNMFEVHATSNPPPVGTELRLATTKLANGTLTETRQIKVKKPLSTTVTVVGVVSFVDSKDARYALSARGVSLLIAVGSAPPPTSTICPAAPTTTSTAPPIASPTPRAAPTAWLASIFAAATTPAPPSSPSALPAIGRRLRVELSLPSRTAFGDAASLRELRRTDLGAVKPPLELAGLISAIDNSKRLITISADGPGITTCKIDLAAPASIDLKKLNTSPPEAVVAHATVDSTGSYTLTGAAPDNDATAAGSLSGAVGDFRRPRHSRISQRRGHR
jgi:hypothetical protein